MDILETTLEQVFSFSFLNKLNPYRSEIGNYEKYRKTFKNSLQNDTPSVPIQRAAFHISLDMVAFQFGQGQDYGFCHFEYEALYDKILNLPIQQINVLYTHLFSKAEWVEEEGDYDWEEIIVFKRNNPEERLSYGSVCTHLTSILIRILEGQLACVKKVLYYKHTPNYWHALAHIPSDTESADQQPDTDETDQLWSPATLREEEDNRVKAILR